MLSEFSFIHILIINQSFLSLFIDRFPMVISPSPPDSYPTLPPQIRAQMPFQGDQPKIDHSDLMLDLFYHLFILLG